MSETWETRLNGLLDRISDCLDELTAAEEDFEQAPPVADDDAREEAGDALDEAADCLTDAKDCLTAVIQALKANR